MTLMAKANKPAVVPAKAERKPKVISLHAKRQFIVLGAQVEAPTARVTKVDEDVYRIEWNPVYDPKEERVKYQRARIVSEAGIQQQWDRLREAVGDEPVIPNEPRAHRRIERDTCALLVRLIKESQGYADTDL